MERISTSITFYANYKPCFYSNQNVLTSSRFIIWQSYTTKLKQYGGLKKVNFFRKLDDRKVAYCNKKNNNEK